ncbi:MAG: hypothetical protein GF329_01150 [Candidatus Lokiarchaeota archaeon]|nr:hypothetical protein [Candidatus Lokiarchaeota archaeon]
MGRKIDLYISTFSKKNPTDRMGAGNENKNGIFLYEFLLVEEEKVKCDNVK